MKKFTCTKCGKPFVLEIGDTAFDKYLLAIAAPKYCFECVKIEREAYVKQKEKEELDTRIAASGIGKNRIRLAKETRDTFLWQVKALKFVRDYSGRTQQKLPYLWGGVGTGKTHIAITFAYKIMEKMKKQVFFSTASDFIVSAIGDKQLFRRLKQTSCPLIIDDLGTHSISQWSVEKIYDLVNHRLNNSLPTLITSNFNPIKLGERLTQGAKEQIEEIICKSISDRLLELCIPIKVDGQSIRKIMFKKSIEKGSTNEGNGTNGTKQVNA